MACDRHRYKLVAIVLTWKHAMCVISQLSEVWVNKEGQENGWLNKCKAIQAFGEDWGPYRCTRGQFLKRKELFVWVCVCVCRKKKLKDCRRGKGKKERGGPWINLVAGYILLLCVIKVARAPSTVVSSLPDTSYKVIILVSFCACMCSSTGIFRLAFVHKGPDFVLDKKRFKNGKEMFKYF